MTINSLLLSTDDLRSILQQMAHDAGHEAATVRTSRDIMSDETEFLITDTRGIHFSGSIPGYWLTLDVANFAQALRKKYPEAFKLSAAPPPLHSSMPLFTRPAGPDTGALDIQLDGSNLMRVYRGATVDQTFDTGDGDKVRVLVVWSHK